MKKLLLCFLLPLCAYAAENNFGGPIDPSKFNDFGKKVLADYFSVWVAAAKEGNIPQDQGLAKIFFDMQHDGVEKVINDEAALKKTNEYYADYQKSPSRGIEDLIKYGLKPGKDYKFPGAAEGNTVRLRITRQNEFYNIMYNDGTAPVMPEKDLVGWYYDLGIKSALESLKLNIDNTKLSPAAIRGIALLQTYFYQNDQKDNENQQ